MEVQNLQEKIDFINAQIHMKRDWLTSHGPGTKRPWPDHDIEEKQYHLKMLDAILSDYQRGKS